MYRVRQGVVYRSPPDIAGAPAPTRYPKRSDEFRLVRAARLGRGRNVFGVIEVFALQTHHVRRAVRIEMDWPTDRQCLAESGGSLLAHHPLHQAK
jgi:hypothetical protein